MDDCGKESSHSLSHLLMSFLFKQLLLKNCAADFVEICKVCTRKVIIKAAKRIFNSDKICRSYCDFYFGVTFLEHTVFKDDYFVFKQCTRLTDRQTEFRQ